MSHNATAETIQAIAQVLKLAGLLDDRVGAPDKARIIAWAEQVQRHNLIEDDLLAGLQAYYDGPHDRPMGVGDLIAHAKTARVTRNQNETQRAIAAQAARADAKAAPDDDLQPLLSAALANPPHDTPRLATAREALQTCQGRAASQAAIREYATARHEALKQPKNIAQRCPQPQE